MEIFIIFQKSGNFWLKNRANGANEYNFRLKNPSRY